MNIIMTDISMLSIFIVPVVPVQLSIVSNGDHDILDTLDGKFNLIKHKKLREISWSSFFPVNKNYGFVPRGALLDGWLYVAFLELMKKYRLPIRIIITNRDKVPVFNSLMSIDELTYNVDKVGDINYSIKVTEFPAKFLSFLDVDSKILKYVKNNTIKYKNELLQKYGLIKDDV